MIFSCEVIPFLFTCPRSRLEFFIFLKSSAVTIMYLPVSMPISTSIFGIFNSLSLPEIPARGVVSTITTPIVMILRTLTQVFIAVFMPVENRIRKRLTDKRNTSGTRSFDRSIEMGIPEEMNKIAEMHGRRNIRLSFLTNDIDIIRRKRAGILCFTSHS